MKTSRPLLRGAASARAAIMAPVLTTLSVACAHAAPLNLHVSTTGKAGPVAACPAADPCDLPAARQLVRDKTAAMRAGTLAPGNIYVNIRPGQYVLSETFRLDSPNDSGVGNFSVIYQKDPAVAGAARLSGGRALGGVWNVDTANNRWWMDVPADLARFRQLYVNGVRAVRARYPNLTEGTPGLTQDYRFALRQVPFTTVTTDLPLNVRQMAGMSAPTRAQLGLDKIELVWLTQFKHKRSHIGAVAINNVTGTTEVGIADTSRHVNTDSGDPANPPPLGTRALPYHFENSLDYLDAPGEWYLDEAAHRLYYKPRANENAAQSPAIAPQVDTLVRIEGAPGATLSNIQIKGLHFEHTNWALPSQYGYMNWQGGIQVQTDAMPTSNAASWIPGAITVLHTSNVVIENNDIRMAGAHGISFRGANTDHRVVRNVLSGLAGGGIYDTSDGYFNHPNGIYPPGPATSTRGVISANLVERTGLDYTDTVGILAAIPTGMSIEFNHVRNAPYSGISIGYRWDAAPNAYGDNVVQRNRVRNVLQLHDDGAGIYSLGYLANSKFKQNFVSDIGYPPFRNGYYKAPISGIYLDQGSKDKEVSDNVLDNTAYAFFVHLAGDFALAPFNKFSRNIYDVTTAYAPHQKTEAKPVEENNLYVAPNVLWSTPDALRTIHGAVRVWNDTQQEKTTRPRIASARASWTNPDFLPAYAINDSLEDKGWSSPQNPLGQVNWWQVDLRDPKRIQKIEVVSRLEYGNDAPSRSNFVVLGSNDPGFTDGGVELARVTAAYPFGGTWSKVIEDAAGAPGVKTSSFQYVRLQKTVAGEYFYLNEVKVHVGAYGTD